MKAPFLEATDYFSENLIFIRMDTIIGFEYVWDDKARIPCVRTHNDTIRVKESPAHLKLFYEKLIEALREEAEKNAPANPLAALFAQAQKDGH